MFEGYKRAFDFMEALRAWDVGQSVRCVYQQKLYEFDEGEWRKDFQVHAGMILEGEWFIKMG